MLGDRPRRSHSMGLSPFPPDELSVPTTERIWRHQHEVRSHAGRSRWSTDLLVRQQRKRRRKPCRLIKTMNRMIIGQFWPQQGSNSPIRRHGSHQGI
jgi:hypothetical protein